LNTENTSPGFPAKRKSSLFGLTTIVLSLIVTFLMLPLMFLLTYGLIEIFSEDTGTLIGYIIWFLVNAAVCFFLCRNNPSGIWYVPIIFNAPFIISAFVESYHWESTEWIFMCCGWGLSLAASISGSILGKKRKS